MSTEVLVFPVTPEVFVFPVNPKLFVLLVFSRSHSGHTLTKRCLTTSQVGPISFPEFLASARQTAPKTSTVIPKHVCTHPLTPSIPMEKVRSKVSSKKVVN